MEYTIQNSLVFNVFFCYFAIIMLVRRAVARALIGGGGGCILIYSCYARLISFEINPNDN